MLCFTQTSSAQVRKNDVVSEALICRSIAQHGESTQHAKRSCLLVNFTVHATSVSPHVNHSAGAACILVLQKVANRFCNSVQRETLFE